ncbi:MAG: ABC transporter ATP-binding protein [Candidatus Berkelbacteria bacterium]|nr:ABC transporter ATP-binding protein [Candidatus Berkelbacteria bacterium]
MAKSIVIEAKKVSKTFKLQGQEIQVLKDINVSVHSGEYVMFYGASGCGKSTLLNVICGLEPPTEGELIVRGESLYGKSQHDITEYRRSKIGIVFQQFNLLKSLTIQENVALPLAAGGENFKRRMDRAAHLLEMVGLTKFLRRRPPELSGGQQQRVAITRALATNPWIIVCDEPTGNLDSRSADEVMAIIERLNSKSKRTVLMVTHNPEYLHFPNRIVYLKDGQVDKEVTNREVTAEAEKTNEKLDLDLRDLLRDKEEK